MTYPPYEVVVTASVDEAVVDVAVQQVAVELLERLRQADPDANVIVQRHL